ncbi:hypothetical protein IB238_16440 [Rhizobium sp. ARZ01]|uniref:hypothetical protein n=1 Tax=Rhizobium sp. ARZ01 TaxID=2769313 RepID=UPI00177D1E80|nr:hypothetical protein [Rhizobium sp. ARZ01]MBD9374212.1 hypothetical protein [Rhizobium sp. ARZ01]
MKLHSALRTTALALTVLALSSPTLAQQAGAFTGGERLYPFTDLPGVTTPEANSAGKSSDVVCTQSYDDVEPRRWGEFKQPVYTCTQNGRTFTSTKPPVSRERDLRGIGW